MQNITIRASLKIISDDKRYDELCNVVGFIGDKGWNKGDKMIIANKWNGKYYRKTTLLVDSGVKTDDICNHIENILNKISGYEKTIQKLNGKEKVNIELYITVEGKNFLSGIHLDNKLLIKLSNLGINLDIDLFK